MQSREIAIVGSGFAGSLLARILTRIGYDVVLIERGTHPRFAIGESSTPLANLSMERIACRYGLSDCHHLATHGRWLEHYPELRRGLKRGFTFYRHHPNVELDGAERLLVAASPTDALSDTHWFRADVDHHFVRESVAAGVDYQDEVTLTNFEVDPRSVRLKGTQRGKDFELRANFIIDASGPGGFLARQLSIPSALDRTETRSALVFSHFEGVKLMRDVAPGFSEGPYPDDWAAVHHLIDEGWMYSLRFDDGLTSAGFVLSPAGMDSLGDLAKGKADILWRTLLDRYPGISSAFADAKPTMPIVYRSGIQHRLSVAAGERWMIMPHAYAFVDPLFSTGIAWALRAVERIALEFERVADNERLPSPEMLDRYDTALAAEADQIDLVVAGAYEAMAHFDLFAAQAMLYFAAVSFAEVSQRLRPDQSVAWNGFLGVNDQVLESLPRQSLDRLRQITQRHGRTGTTDSRKEFADWIAEAIAPRNVAGLANLERNNLYPVDFDALIEKHELLGMTRNQLVDSLPALRGMSPQPSFTFHRDKRNAARDAQKSANANRKRQRNIEESKKDSSKSGAAERASAQSVADHA